MSKRNHVLSATAPQLEQQYGNQQSQKIVQAAARRLEELCRENAADIKAVKTHTEQKIYPIIALYEAMQQAGIPKDEAMHFLDRCCSEQAEPQAASIRAMLKLPGLYKKMPAMFRWVAKNQFGEKAGFRATYYKTEKTRVKFDMTQCLYCDVCRKYGVPELVPCFCHTDDVTDGHMHPKLCWNRTKIMGDGADCCDFDLFVKE